MWDWWVSKCIVRDSGARLSIWPMGKVGKDRSKKSLIWSSLSLWYGFLVGREELLFIKKLLRELVYVKWNKIRRNKNSHIWYCLNWFPYLKWDRSKCAAPAGWLVSCHVSFYIPAWISPAISRNLFNPVMWHIGQLGFLSNEPSF